MYYRYTYMTIDDNNYRSVNYILYIAVRNDLTVENDRKFSIKWT